MDRIEVKKSPSRCLACTLICLEGFNRSGIVNKEARHDRYQDLPAFLSKTNTLRINLPTVKSF